MLAGIRVVEIGQILSAPFAAAIFADLGAEVIKVEKPQGGDDARAMGKAFRDTDSLHFLDINRGKASITLDLKTPAGIAELHELLATADIVIHNMRPGVVEALGIDGASLCARHPRLVYCEITGYGKHGPKKDLPAFEPVAQAFSGLMSVNGHPDAAPARVGVSVVDIGTAMWVAIGALAALQRRQLTGRGGIVNASLLETALGWIGPQIASYLNEQHVPKRLGTAHASLVPYQTFDASDGALLIAAGNDRLFEKLARALGAPEWADDPRFCGNRDRLAHRATLVDLIAARIATAPRATWVAKLNDAGVPCAPVNTIPEVLEDPQVAALGMLEPVEGVTLAGLPLSFDGTRPRIAKLGPRLGADNNATFSGAARRSRS